MMPPQELFAKTMDEMKIFNEDNVIIYGKAGSYFTPRTWFLFRSMGHHPDRVHLMRGSFEHFQEAGGEIETGGKKIPLAKDILKRQNPTYVANAPKHVIDMEQMMKALNEDALIIDPRGSSFEKSGHMPGALHMPYADFVEEHDSLKLKSKEELQSLFQNAGIDVNTDRTIVTTCGSGVSVCHVLLALEECGRSSEKPTLMYDGSWTEWSKDAETPKVIPKE